MRALVTGGAGFIGSNLVRVLLRNGYEVLVLDNLSTGTRANLPQDALGNLVVGDIRDASVVRSAVRGCDDVFHLAASVGNQRSIDDPLTDAEINVIGTIHVLAAARDHGVRSLVYSSSAAVFGELMSLPIAEDHRTEPDTPYGASKLAAEKQCLAWGKVYGISVACLRYFNVYGPGQRYDAYGNVIPIFANQIRRGELLKVYGDGEQTRDFVHVDDVVAANLAAARHRATGAYNIGSGRAHSINCLLLRLRDVSKRSFVVAYGPERPGDVRHSVADISRAVSHLGYQPSRTLGSGLREYLEWSDTHALSGDPATVRDEAPDVDVRHK